MNCNFLVKAPDLTATRITESAYENMFSGCTSLTTAPELPATTLAVGCYNSMFLGCTSLTTAPELPATTLLNSCYHFMFYKCAKLTYIKALFITEPGSIYTNYWVNGVSNTGTFVRSASATWESSITRGVDNVPEGWTIITDANA